MNLKEYKQLIKNANTKEELHEISYKAMMEDNSTGCLINSKSFYNKVIRLCIEREIELDLANI